MKLAAFALLAFVSPCVGQCIGDLDADGFVNRADVVIVLEVQGCVVEDPLGDCSSADIDADGDVDSDDLLLLVYKYLGPCPTGEGHCPVDVNSDDTINIFDYFGVWSWWDQDCWDGQGDDHECTHFDLDGSGIIDYADLCIVVYRSYGEAMGITNCE